MVWNFHLFINQSYGQKCNVLSVAAMQKDVGQGYQKKKLQKERFFKAQ